MNHNHYIPTNAAHRAAIQAIWQVAHTPLFGRECIIPKGVVEVIFNFSDTTSIQAQIGNKQIHLQNCFISGFNTSRIEIELPRKQVFFGVLFQPSAVKKIFKVPAGEFADTTVDLTLINPAFNSLWQQFAQQESFEGRVNVFLQWLNNNLADWSPREQLMNNFLYATDQHNASVAGLANILCYSPRHLSRKFFEVTGMNTEEVLLYKKYLHAVGLMHQNNLSLTEIAHQSHFADQSHFIKTFKAYADITPGEYQRKMSFVKGHIYEDVR